MTTLASIGLAVRSKANNPWLDRLLASLQRSRPGVPRAELRVEEGDRLTKVEKLNRLLRHGDARYVCLLEDDTEILHDDWLGGLLAGMAALPGVALAGPQEASAGEFAPEAIGAALSPTVADVTNCPGFCLVVDREADLFFDVRVQTMSDLHLSLLARSRGWRCARVQAALVRHTKLPWAPDTVPPWQQGDRSRFGEADAYYARDRHQARRVAEARFLLDQFGDLARQALPQELLAVVEPEAEVSMVIQPGCGGCRRQIPAGDEYVMTAAGPICLPCRFGPDFAGTPHVSEETALALALAEEDG